MGARRARLGAAREAVLVLRGTYDQGRVLGVIPSTWAANVSF